MLNILPVSSSLNIFVYDVSAWLLHTAHWLYPPKNNFRIALVGRFSYAYHIVVIGSKINCSVFYIILRIVCNCLYPV